MTYANPDIVLLSNPIGIDAVIQSIQQDLYGGLTWLQKSFGRAWEFKEINAEGRMIKVPKCYMGQGEYMNVLPNDYLQAQSFIAVRGEETRENYQIATMSGNMRRQLSVIVWVNLKEIDDTNDTIFTELLKSQVEKLLEANPYVASVDRYYDERVEDVFDGYIDGSQGGAYSVDDTKTQYLMYPYSGFRIDITAAYPEHVDCSTWNTWPQPIPSSGESTDLYFRVGTPGYLIEGTTTFQDDRMIGRKVRLFRGGVVQTPYSNFGYSWSFSSATGTLTIAPAWKSDEDVHIQII